AKAEPAVKIAVIVSTVIAMVSLSGLLVFCYCIFKRKEKCREMDQQNDQTTDGENEDLELPHFEFAKIVNATNKLFNKKQIRSGRFWTCLQ
ncbi:hypothetical protein D5086_003577, partial [Populus alba]